MNAKYPKMEIACQASLYKELVGNYDVKFQNKIMTLWNEEVREIIDQFEDQMDRVPSGDEIIWVMSERRHKDIREIVRQIKEADGRESASMGENPTQAE